MATRTRRAWTLDKQGQYARQIGWKQQANGKLVQHKFRLGRDLREAKRREQRLRDIWDDIERSTGGGKALWDDEALAIAKQVARGISPIQLPLETDEELEAYARRIHLMQRKYAAVPIVAGDFVDYSLGAKVMGLRYDSQLQAREAGLRFFGQASEQDAINCGILPPSGPKVDATLNSGPRLHEALDAYVEWVREDYFRPSLGRVNDSGLTILRQLGTLKERHDNVPISTINYESIERMFRYWRQRPIRKGSTEAISKTSAKHYLGLLKRFLRWLHQSPEFDWRKPDGFDDVATKIELVPDEQQRKLTQVKTFGIDELAKLNEFATPLERVFLLLGVNCGFGLKEIATLTVEEVVLFQAHSKREQEILGYETTETDSFIKRIRRKNSVYGEWILFPQTVEALQWALRWRKKFPGFSPSARVVVNSRGEPYDKPTKGGNRNQQIPNRFGDLVRRVRAKHPDFPILSVGKLRKTAGDMMRQCSDGEIAGVFLCHGQAVRTDDLADIYTNRPYGKVFAAIRKVEGHLKPFFDAAGPHPFSESEPASKSRGRRRRKAK